MNNVLINKYLFMLDDFAEIHFYYNHIFMCNATDILFYDHALLLMKPSY